MIKFDKFLVLSAVRDAFFTDSYDEYSIGNGWTLVRNSDVECWEDEGFSILDDNDEAICAYCVEAFCNSEEDWFFNKGTVLKKMVDDAYKTSLSCYEDFKHIAEFYYPEDLVQALNGGEMTKDEAVEAALHEVTNILTDWNEGDYFEDDWWGVVVPILKEYFTIVRDDCGSGLPIWIKEDIEAIQYSFSAENEIVSWEE